MKLRNGSHGEDMWNVCRHERVAAITYPGIHNVDFRPYSRGNHPPGWDQIGSPGAKGSIALFAWDIRGGDSIYVGDSASHKIVGMGYATTTIGELAYRFDAHSPISPDGEEPWCHLIDMDWESNFAPFDYEDRAPQTTVLRLEQNEIRSFDQYTQATQHRDQGLEEQDVQDTLLLETCYPRYTPATRRLIHRKHVIISNCFKRWLESTYGIRVSQERQQIDAAFEAGGKRYLAEFKIAYMGDTKRAIREALGQILEYNHYPPRVGHHFWLLILDTTPSEHDIVFVRLLRDKFRFPLSLGWQTDSAFDFEPTLNL